MAKKRRVIGSIVKGKDGKPDYIKIREDVTLRSGQFLNLENKASKIAGIRRALEMDKLSQEVAEKMLAQAEQLPEFVRFEIVLLENRD